jgi:cytochrome c
VQAKRIRNASNQWENAMKNLLLGLALIAPLAATPALAGPMEDLAKSKQCFDCHDTTRQLTASSFKAIATKYKGVKNAEATLADIIMKGESGHFGGMTSGATMPPGARVKLTADEAKSLAVWVLNTK